MRQLARTSDPATSYAAAAAVGQFIASHHQRIHEALREMVYASAEELEQVVGIPAYAIRKRLPEMQRMGLCRPTDALRKTASGRDERVWGAL